MFQANVNHTISGQETAVSTLDHSATTPRTYYDVYFQVCYYLYHIKLFYEVIQEIINIACGFCSHLQLCALFTEGMHKYCMYLFSYCMVIRVGCGRPD